MPALLLLSPDEAFAEPGDIRAVWDHSGKGLYPGNWSKTMSVLKSSRITDLFLNVAGPDFAHYASARLPRSKVCRELGDQLAACLRAARGTGVRVHAWVICFNATRGVPTSLEDFRRRGWRLMDSKGALTTYLDPANPTVRAYVLAIIDEIVRQYAVAGVHLDFVRWGETVGKPANAASAISLFVADARRFVRHPRWLTAAVYGTYPSCISTVGQDWPRWIDSGIVDYAVPMDYTSSATHFRKLLSMQMSSTARVKRTIVGIGVTANESTLDAGQVADQISFVRQCGFAGVSLFDLDAKLERQILPALNR